MLDMEDENKNGRAPTNVKTEAEKVLSNLPSFEARMRERPINIKGCNVGEIETEFKRLSEWGYYDDDRKEMIGRIESLYSLCEEESKKAEISQMEVEDGKVVLHSGMTNHVCSGSLNVLRMISETGVLASEWFGIRESEGEGAFCAFIDRIHDEENGVGAKIANKRRLLPEEFAAGVAPAKGDVLLFFDDNNSVMQKLIHLDYFEYEKIKQEQPESLSDIYTEEEIKLFDRLIEPISPAGKKFHTKEAFNFRQDWSAIPGGIPATLINGICTKNNRYSEEYLDELQRLFPNATIFDGDRNVLRIPQLAQEGV